MRFVSGRAAVFYFASIIINYRYWFSINTKRNKPGISISLGWGIGSNLFNGTVFNRKKICNGYRN